MTYLMIGVISTIFFVGIVAAMWFGWSRQRARQEVLYPEPAAVPGAQGTGQLHVDVAYVATTRGDDPFARLMAHGLGVRGNATFTARADGMVIDRDGERSFFVPAADITGAEPASTAIDRGVEADGLVAVAWRLGNLPVVTTLRPAHPSDKDTLFAAIESIIDARSDPR